MIHTLVKSKYIKGDNNLGDTFKIKRQNIVQYQLFDFNIQKKFNRLTLAICDKCQKLILQIFLVRNSGLVNGHNLRLYINIGYVVLRK